jgi:hypothetical protein
MGKPIECSGQLEGRGGSTESKKTAETERPLYIASYIARDLECLARKWRLIDLMLYISV